MRKEEIKLGREIKLLRELIDIERFDSDKDTTETFSNATLITSVWLAFLAFFIYLGEEGAILITILVWLFLMVLTERRYNRRQNKIVRRHNSIGTAIVERYSKLGINLTSLENEIKTYQK